MVWYIREKSWNNWDIPVSNWVRILSKGNHNIKEVVPTFLFGLIYMQLIADLGISWVRIGGSQIFPRGNKPKHSGCAIWIPIRAVFDESNKWYV